MKKSMRGTQGPMAQNRPKSDTMATERQAHEACESNDKRGSMHGKSHGSSAKPMSKKSDSDRAGGY